MKKNKKYWKQRNARTFAALTEACEELETVKALANGELADAKQRVAETEACLRTIRSRRPLKAYSEGQLRDFITRLQETASQCLGEPTSRPVQQPPTLGGTVGPPAADATLNGRQAGTQDPPTVPAGYRPGRVMG